MPKHLRSNGKAKMTRDELAALHPLAAWRLKNGVSQARLAEQAGVTQAMISAIEVGKRVVSKDVATRLRDVTRIAVKRLLDANERVAATPAAAAKPAGKAAAAGSWLD